MKNYIFDYDKNEKREINTNFLTLLQWVKVNFCGWGFYRVTKTATNKYKITDVFDNKLKYTINYIESAKNG